VKVSGVREDREGKDWELSEGRMGRGGGVRVHAGRKVDCMRAEKERVGNCWREGWGCDEGSCGREKGVHEGRGGKAWELSVGRMGCDEAS
jgi:hypothetical protein